ncbi:phenylacetate-CoA oxygenase subunit PaaC [Alicyclobacillus sp. SO9]|nr:phenylacetate-CoA oxygenase subunit PaaC [Alicyclobacillus sp. SO9]
MGDDELIFGHRCSEWLGLAPDLEEDIAFSSMAQDEIGHASLFYSIAESLSGTSADRYAFSRGKNSRLNAMMLETKNGDWADTIVRSYLYNAFEQVRLKECLKSNFVSLQQAAAKILREERYHLLHMETWFEKLARSQGEARQRLLRALQDIWPNISDLFDLGVHADSLVRHGIISNTSLGIYSQWESIVRPVFAKAAIDWPGKPVQFSQSGRVGQHTSAMDEILLTMTEVLSLDAQAVW